VQIKVEEQQLAYNELNSQFGAIIRQKDELQASKDLEISKSEQIKKELEKADNAYATVRAAQDQLMRERDELIH
jgi:hypothetical protein